MAAPTYATDLTVLTLCETTTGFSALGGGGAGLGTGSDFAIQGTLCVDKQVTSATKGMMWDNGSGITMGADDHVFIWNYAATPGLLDTLANGGKRISIGTSTSNYNDYYVEGSVVRPAGGNKCYAVRYSTSTPSPGLQVGTPTANPQWFGGQLNTTGSVKGVNLGLDAMRYGTGIYITAGDVPSPGTFAGAAAANDAVSARWGVLAAISGGYELQGRLAIGQNTSKVATAARFVASNVNVVLTATPHSLSTFTQIIIDHASTVVQLTNVNFTALGTNNPGRFVCNNASTVCTIVGGGLTDLGITTLRAAMTLTNFTWRRCAAITQNGATITGGSIIENNAAVNLLVDDISKITNVNFESDGTGHGIRYRPTGAGPFSVNLSGAQFSAYAASDGSTGNEAILIDPVTASANITLNIIGGGSTPSIMLAAGYTGTFTLVVAPVTLAIAATDAETLAVIEGARVIAWATAGGSLPANASVTITRSGTTATVTHTAHGLATGNIVLIRDANQVEYNGPQTITVTGANSYTYVVAGSPTTPATGTITSSAVIINNVLTNGSGLASDTRSYATSQPVTGFVTRGTVSPVYKATSFNGTISSSIGLTLGVSMARD